MKTTFTAKSGLSLLLCLTGLLLITTPKALADEGDPPTRVARLSYTDGSVSLQPGGTGDWGAAAKNRPVTIGDKIWSDKDSRAELQAGQASIHIGSMTALSFLNLDENVIQMRLAEGSINFRVRELRQGDLYEVDAPNLAFTVKQAGAFRIDVNENGDASRVTVLRGEGEVTAGGKTYEIHTGESGEFNGSENPESNISQAPGPDGLDQWASERDTHEDNSVSARYVSRDVPGYSDLDDNGTWSEEPDYGPVWRPSAVAVGWAPYSYGYWNWVGPWGWTWVDYAPWGFAPFHYGRWAFIGGSWGWCPGAYLGYPVYGPAFVSFFGGGFGFGFGFGGGIGWFPLGFGEPFFPGFRCSRGFINNINIRNTRINNVNIFNTTNIHNFNFANAHNPAAVTVASRNAFVNGQAINRGAAHITAASLKGAQVSNRASFSPTKQSFMGSANAGARVRTPSSAVQNRAVMARNTPAARASHLPVHTINSRALVPGRAGNSPVNNAMNRGANRATNQHASSSNISGNAGRSSAMSNNTGMTARQRELSSNRPPSGTQGMSRTQGNLGSTSRPTQGRANNSRTWEAQGTATDRGRAPQGFGQSNSPARGSDQVARTNRSDRPPWAGSSQSSGAISRGQAGSNNSPNGSFSRQGGASPRNNTRAPAPNSGNRSNNYAPQRSYSPPQRSYSAPQRSYPAPSRSYSAPSRSYSAPSRSYSAPSRSYSAPSRSYGGGGSRSSGGSPRGSGGSSSHGGGGGGSSHAGGSSSHSRH